MRLLLPLTVCAILLAGCRSAPLTPTAAGPAGSDTPFPALSPTATSLAEGMAGRVATPDPSLNCREAYTWFFDNPARECAAILLHTWAVMQPFEHGLMVWTQEGGRTYVMVDDGSLFRPYHEVTDPSTADLPGPDPGIVPPEGFFQPELGFAKFWRGLVPGSEWIRGQLGWALSPEVGYPAFWQCNDASGSTARCYFTGPADEIISLTRSGAEYWNYWQGPVR